MVETFSAGTETDECANGVRHMMETGISASGHTHVSNHKAQVLTKWMLLEQLSGILQCQPWTITPPARVDSREKIHSRMEGVLKAVETWPEIFESLKSHVRLMHNAKQSDFLLPASSTLTVIQDAHLRGLKILHGARRSVRLSKYATMERNVQYMVFMVHWHSTVSSPVDFVNVVSLNGYLEAQHSVPPRCWWFFSAPLRRQQPNGVPGPSWPRVRRNG